MTIIGKLKYKKSFIKNETRKKLIRPAIPYPSQEQVYLWYLVKFSLKMSLDILF